MAILASHHRNLLRFLCQCAERAENRQQEIATEAAIYALEDSDIAPRLRHHAPVPERDEEEAGVERAGLANRLRHAPVDDAGTEVGLYAEAAAGEATEQTVGPRPRHFRDRAGKKVA